MAKFLTIGEASKELDVPDYVLRFWETKFKAIHPAKRRGGRRYYSDDDVEMLRKIKNLLHAEAYTIKDANVILNNKFVDIKMAAQKKNTKEKHQFDMFGQNDISAEVKTKLQELLGRLKEVQSLLVQDNIAK